MPNLDDLRALLATETGLVTVSSASSDLTVVTSVVNAGILPHPVGGAEVIGLVSRADAVRVRHAAVGRPLTVTARRGWKWVSARGPADLIGPDHPRDGINPDALRQLLRDIFHAAGGTHDDLEDYDRVMAAERRVAVLVHPDRLTGVS
jgi:hypothetical protein